MEAFGELIKVCKKFINNDFSIEEFQHKIEMIVLPDKCKKTLEKEQHNACNKLEEIRYCYFDSQKVYANKVANSLIQATLKEQERLKRCP
jgi:hypothetical protein